MKHMLIAATVAFAAGAIAAAAQSPACAPSGGLTFICGVANPEDLVLVPEHTLDADEWDGARRGLHLVDTRAKSSSSMPSGPRISAPIVRSMRTAPARSIPNKRSSMPEL
jgi:hypothetical protein